MIQFYDKTEWVFEKCIARDYQGGVSMETIIDTLTKEYEALKIKRQKQEARMYASQAFDQLDIIDRIYKKEDALRAAIAALKEGYSV